MNSKTKQAFFLAAFVLITGAAQAQQSATSVSKKENSKEMKTYVIEREVNGAGNLSAEDLKNISKTSCGVLKQLGSGIEWLHSYVAGNKIYCIYKAESEELIREHAKKGGFPANSITPVASIISPATAQ